MTVRDLVLLARETARISVLLTATALIACGDGDQLPFKRDAEAVTVGDQPPDDEEPATPDDQEPPPPRPVELPPDESTADAGGLDAQVDSDAAQAEADAASPDVSDDGALSAADDAALPGDPDSGSDAGGEIDAGLDASPELDAQTLDAAFDASPELDAQTLDAALDSAVADSGPATPDASADGGACPDGGRDACGVCGGSATSCHPLFGRYAARTQLYARQRTELAPGTPEAQPIDLVSKGTLLSLVEIDAQGRAHEHYCLLELGGTAQELETVIASWTQPSASQRIPDTTLQLELASGRYVRQASAHRAYFGWLADGAPANCVAGQLHTSGCRCPSNALLPTLPTDCRVRDPEQDGVPGGNMYLTLDSKPRDPELEKGLLELRLAALLSFGWSLPATSTTPLVGTISGGFQLSELSRAGSVATLLGPVENTACPENLGHIELVRNDSASCASILAGRVAAPDNAGIFNLSLDAPIPATTACADPACSRDADADSTPDCRDACPADPAKIAAGACGCGVAETNSDGDSAPNCADGCPQDARKLLPGACGCGVADTNSDGDALPDCTDACDNDANKTVGGLCGCGVADTNTDGDALPNCTDGCPTNAAKTAPGTCGCAAADTDSDRDGVPNCNDACVDDATKTTLGLCGCGVADTNSDGDSQPDCLDACDNDGNKVTAGLCGCGVADTNTDGDSRPNCTDGCPSDASKIAAGVCGCGVAETNSDGDSLPDCTDACDNDANKVAAGACGCGVADTNSDGDSQPDCNEQCDADRNKLVPGICGCGVADADLNGDGTVDCGDSCPSDPAKVAPGLCGCGVADTNTDGDSRPNCTEDCDTDPNKLVAGQCGCGIADTDTDSDGVANCNDACPNDPTKTGSSLCGCGVSDADSDGDGTPNCNDVCPNDRTKIAAGLCGCGVADTNTDGDSRPNCTDGCPTDANKIAAGVCGCGVAETNTDGDSLPNCTDGCPNDANKIAAGVCGCGVAETNTDGDAAPNCTDQCDDDRNKVTPGLCGCGVADTNTDGDSLPDCTDECDTNPALTVQGACGCTACPSTNPLVGTFAVRSAVFGKQRNGSEVVSSKSINYSLVTVTQNSDGTLRLSEQGCWTQSVPNPNEAGTKAYSWSKPAWVQAIAPSVQNLVANSNGTYTRAIPIKHFGWDPARQPANCTTTATPVAPWPSAWGPTCTCNTPATSLPPYDRNAAPYDCRLVDVDGDGQPGLSAIAATAAPSSPEANAPLIGGTAFAAVDATGSWLITPQSTGRHTATINDQAVAQLVGCTGLACSQLAATPPGSLTCPQALNRAQFVPSTTSSDSCSELIAARDTLFVQNQDPAWPDATACPPP